MAKPFFEPEQRRAFWFAATTFLCGLALIAFHSSYAAGAWPSLPHTEKDGFFLYLVLSTTGEFGTSLIVAALLALFFELVIRRREFAEIGDLIKSVKYSNEIVDAFPRRHQLDSTIEADINKAKTGELIDLIGTSQRVLFSEHPGYEALADRISSGLRLRILILHPDSMLLPCIESVSKDFGFPDVRLSIHETVRGRISRMCSVLAKSSVRGSIEIRMHRDLYSTLAYYHSSRLTVLGLYFSHESGTQCPALSLAKGEIASAARLHFETLWEMSADNVLIRIDQDNRYVEFDKYFPLSSKPSTGADAS